MSLRRGVSCSRRVVWEDLYLIPMKDEPRTLQNGVGLRIEYIAVKRKERRAMHMLYSGIDLTK